MAKKYYNYVYQIKNCPDNNCSSNNHFIQNKTIVDLDTDFYGVEYGAIYNNCLQIGNVIADFIKNTSYLGAAILNRGQSNKIAKINSLTGDFINNEATSSGGAIYNSSLANASFPLTSTITNSSFLNNSAEIAGGALYHRGIINIIADGYDYIDTYFQVEEGDLKIKPMIKVFAADDDIDLQNDAGGKSQFQGIIAGVETSPMAHSSGWKSVYNIYTAYAAGSHKISSQKLKQKTGYLGLGGILYKNKFFAGATLNAAVTENASAGNSNKFMSYQAGAALKAGYNVNFGTDYLYFLWNSLSVKVAAKAGMPLPESVGIFRNFYG